MSLLHLKVASTSRETDLVRRIALESTGPDPLPGYDAGAYVTVRMPVIGRRRYSLVNVDPAQHATTAPHSYLLGVRLDEAGGGGSRWMHALTPGVVVEVESPENDFALTPGNGPVMLVAGGIGVTPLVSKAAAMKAIGRPFRLVYAARRRADLAFLPEIRELAGDGLRLHLDEEEGGVLDVASIVASLEPGEAMHVCGPKPMLQAAIHESRRLDWPADRLRFERFFSLGDVPAAPAAPAVPAAAEPAEPAPAPQGDFEVEIASTGQVFKVPPDRSILAVLLEAGLDPLHDCLRGECGVCQVGVVSGTPDHRDSILSDAERAAGKVMQICISRAISPRLVLDL